MKRELETVAKTGSGISVKKKTIKKLAGAVLLISLLFALCIFVDNVRLKKIDAQGFTDAPSNFTTYIDSVTEGKNSFTVEGFAFIKGQNNDVIDDRIALKDPETGSFYIINTQPLERKDVTDYYNKMFKDKYNYNKSGFCAKVEKFTLKRNAKYEIYLIYCNNSNHVLYDTQHSITREG